MAGGPGGETWRPVNNHFADTATHTLRVTAPAPNQAAANGAVQEIVAHDGTTTNVRDSRDLIASHLSTFHTGPLEIETFARPAGLSPPKRRRSSAPRGAACSR